MKQSNILIVENNNEDAEFLLTVLRQEGYIHLYRVEHAAAAIAILQDKVIGAIDIIITTLDRLQ